MWLRDRTIGAINVFRDDDRTLADADLGLAQALADIATIGILQERASRESTHVATQLQATLHGRSVIEQARGMLAQHHRVSLDEAFDLLHQHASRRGERLADTARMVANRELDLNEVARSAT